MKKVKIRLWLAVSGPEIDMVFYSTKEEALKATYRLEDAWGQKFDVIPCEVTYAPKKPTSLTN